MQIQESVQSCGLCNRVSCDGKIYVVPYDYEYYGRVRGVKFVCTSNLSESGGYDKAFEIVCAHGVKFLFKAFDIPEPLKLS